MHFLKVLTLKSVESQDQTFHRIESNIYAPISVKPQNGKGGGGGADPGTQGNLACLGKPESNSLPAPRLTFSLKVK